MASSFIHPDGVKLIVIAVLVFLLAEGFVTYTYLKQSRQVRWWLFIGILVVAMIGFVLNFGAILVELSLRSY